VPRPESEGALARIVALLRAGTTRIALEGPPASGKTLLLHVLPARLGPAFASAYLPHPGLGPAEVRAWLASFGEPLPADAGVTLEDLVFAYARRGPGLVLLIDDANGMPEAVAHAFGALLAHTGASLRIVVAGVANAELDAVVHALGGPAERVRLGPPRSQAAPSDSWAPPLVPASPPVAAAAPPRASAATSLRPAAASPPPAAAAGAPAAVALSPSVASTARAPASSPRAAATLPAQDASQPGAALAVPPTAPAPQRPPLLTAPRAAALVTVAFAAATALVLLRPGARDELPDVAAAASATLADPTPEAVTAAAADRAPAPVPVHLNARPWARVFVDDRELGVTPLGNVPVEPGLRHFRAELSDGRTVERDVRIEAANQRVTFP
jgi:hypothetical protein